MRRFLNHTQSFNPQYPVPRETCRRNRLAGVLEHAIHIGQITQEVTWFLSACCWLMWNGHVAGLALIGWDVPIGINAQTHLYQTYHTGSNHVENPSNKLEMQKQTHVTLVTTPEIHMALNGTLWDANVQGCHKSGEKIYPAAFPHAQKTYPVV